MSNGNPTAASTWKRWLLGVLSVVVALVVLVLLTAWWTMIRMPRRSHRGALPAADEAIESLAEELRRDVQQLAVDIGERNISQRPQQLSQAAEYIDAQFVLVRLWSSERITTLSPDRLGLMSFCLPLCASMPL